MPLLLPGHTHRHPHTPQGLESALDLLLGITLNLSSPLACLFYFLTPCTDFSLTSSLSTCGRRGMVDLTYSHPPSLLPSLFSHPSSPARCHPFYCKPCDWQLQLQVLQRAFTSAAWLCKDPTLPPASTPIRPTGLPPSNRLQVRPKKDTLIIWRGCNSAQLSKG